MDLVPVKDGDLKTRCGSINAGQLGFRDPDGLHHCDTQYAFFRQSEANIQTLWQANNARQVSRALHALLPKFHDDALTVRQTQDGFEPIQPPFRDP